MTVGQTVAGASCWLLLSGWTARATLCRRAPTGRVIARVQKHYTASQSLTAEASVYTGRSSVQATLYLPWRSYTDEPEDPLTGITQTDWLPVQLAAWRCPPAFAA